MKAIIIKEYGGTEQLELTDIPTPQPENGEVLIRIKAFGINRADTYMRQGAWGDVAKVSGIECVGEVENDPSGKLKQGQKVAAIMGGMGLTINGSYAEFTCIPSTNVFPIETSLSWADFAAIPETYATAWSCLHDNMHIKEGDTVFIRGGTSAVGQAAINIASHINHVSVIATTRNPDNVSLLKSLGCDEVLIEEENLHSTLLKKYPDGVDSVLDMIGNSTLLDSLKMAKAGGYVCNAGFLGGGDPIPFNPLLDMPPAVNLNFFASFMFGTPSLPISSVPMQTIINHVESGVYKAKPSNIFNFEDPAKAQDLMESNQASSKIVVTL